MEKPLNRHRFGPFHARTVALALALAGCAAYARPARALDAARSITQYSLKNWTSRSGLPQNSVNAILQTRDGYLWFGTEEGLVRFDGTQFTIFNHKNSPELHQSSVACLCETRDGSLWIGTQGGGITRYAKGRFTSLTTYEGLASNTVMSILEDESGVMWFGTYGGLTRFQDGKFQVFSRHNGFVNVYIRSMALDGHGGLWIGTAGGGLGHFKDGHATFMGPAQGLADSVVGTVYRDRAGRIWAGQRSGRISVLEDGRIARTYGAAQGLPAVPVHAIYEDRSGVVWAGTSSGLARLQGERFTVLDAAHGLPSDDIACLFEDRESNLWTGTMGGGLNLLQDGKVICYGPPEGLSHAMAGPMLQDRSGTVWVGTFGGGLDSFRDGKWTRHGRKEGLPDLNVTALGVDHENALWVSTFGGHLTRFVNGRAIQLTGDQAPGGHGVATLFTDRRGDVWAGTSGDGAFVYRNGHMIHHYGYQDSLGNGFIRTIFEDRSGDLWFGCFSGGVTRFHDGKFTRFRKCNGLSSDIVLCFFQDPEGGLWIGTYGGGLSRYKNGKFVSIDAEAGLFDDNVFSMVADDQGRLWMSCNNGVFRAPLRQLMDLADGHITRIHCSSYGDEDGMRTRECNATSPPVMRTTDGRLWYPTINGVVTMDPARIPFNAQQPPVSIDAVLVDGKAIPAGQSISVPPGRGQLEIRYAALSFVSPQKVRFQYRLEGFDKTWVEAGTRRIAYYTNLPPGRYKFNVTACNNDGVWNERGASLEVRLAPHFYQTWWFALVCLLCSGSAVYALYHRRVRGLQLLVTERTRAKEELEGTNNRLENALSDLQRAQSGLIEQERLRALGQMASGVTHDFNNALAPILGFTDLMLMRPQMLENKERVIEYLQTIHTAAKDAANVVNRLREFYRAREVSEVFPPVSLNALVDQALALTQPKWKGQAQAGGITIQIDKDLDDIAAVPGNESDLRELLTNLIFNAVDAMPDGGTLTLRTRADGAQVWLEVRDSGTGMTEEVRRRCLEPFFTTKGEGGTGLGLPMVYGIVQRHEGSVDIQSEPGHGTRFCIRLPLTHSRMGNQVEPTEDAELPPMDVLVVDDEPGVLRFVKDFLEGDHHRVETAGDGVEGLKKFYSHKFDLVVMDRAMPRMSGDQLAAAIKQAQPGTPVILLTGFGELMSAQNEKPPGVDAVVSKPVSTRTLRRAISRLKAA